MMIERSISGNGFDKIGGEMVGRNRAITDTGPLSIDLTALMQHRTCRWPRFLATSSISLPPGSAFVHLSKARRGND
jgi:hypothetical protein